MPLKLAILDTNILDYGFKPDYATSVANLLTQLSQQYDLVTTQFTRFELFRGMSSSRIPDAKLLFDSFNCIDVTGDIFKIAAALSTCYKNDKATSSRASSYSDGDIIIGAAGFVSDAAIITANVNDFPRPYFEEVVTGYNITSIKKGTMITIGILKPSIAYLNHNIALSYPPIRKESAVE